MDVKQNENFLSGEFETVKFTGLTNIFNDQPKFDQFEQIKTKNGETLTTLKVKTTTPMSIRNRIYASEHAVLSDDFIQSNSETVI